MCTALIGSSVAFADEWDKKTIVTLKDPLEVPGVTLQPGTYVFKLLNSSSDRHIVEIMNDRQNQLITMTFTAAARRLEPDWKGRTVFTFYETADNRPMAMRQWYYPGDLDGQEFLYPHNQAVSIAKVTHTTVREKDGGVATAEAPAPVPSPLIANAAPAPAPPEPAVTPSESNSQATVETQSQVEVENKQTEIAQNEPPPPPPVTAAQPSPSPSEQSLPQTGSDLPAVGLAGLALLLCAAGVRVFARQQ
jgi:LPXTG-motif cell wall-anchored protein